MTNADIPRKIIRIISRILLFLETIWSETQIIALKTDDARRSTCRKQKITKEVKDA